MDTTTATRFDTLVSKFSGGITSTADYRDAADRAERIASYTQFAADCGGQTVEFTDAARVPAADLRDGDVISTDRGNTWHTDLTAAKPGSLVLVRR